MHEVVGVNIFSLGPAYEAIYGGPMAYIHDKVVDKPGRAGLFSFLLSLPLLLTAAAHFVLVIEGGFLVLGFAVQMALAPLIYALHDARTKTESLDDMDRMPARYRRKLRRRAQKEQPEQTSVILNKRD